MTSRKGELLFLFASLIICIDITYTIWTEDIIHAQVLLIVGSVFVLPIIGLLAYDRWARRGCRTNGHPNWKQVGDPADDSVPHYQVCTRCGERKDVEHD